MTELQPIKFTDSVNNIEFRLQGDNAPQEIIRLDSKGFHYRGQLIEDAGEAHRLMVEFLKQQTQPEPPEPLADLAAKLLAESKPMDPQMAAALTTEARWGLCEGSPTPRPEPVAPTDEELLELLSRVSGLPNFDAYIVDGGRIMSEPVELLAYARAVLARYGTPTIQPEPVAPTDEALANFSGWFCRNYPGPDTIIHEPEWHAPKVFRAAADALTRWGTPAIQPVPVSERLPGPEDCDEDGWCWWFDGFNWMLGRFENWHTHWLPHHALPTPETTDD